MKDFVFHENNNINIVMNPVSEDINRSLFCLACVEKDSKLAGFIYYYSLTPISLINEVFIDNTMVTITSGDKFKWFFEISVFNESKSKRINDDLYWLPIMQKQFICNTLDINSFAYDVETNTLLDYSNTIIEGKTDLPSFQNNVFTGIENQSDDEVSITDMLINNKTWWTLEGILKDIGLNLNGEIGFDEVKKIWDFTRKKISCGKTYQHLFNDEMSKISIIDFFNCFGSGACGTYNSILTLLCAASGIPSRRGSLSDGSHVISQIMQNDRDIVLDAFYGADNEGDGIRGSFFINHDGNPASYDDLCHDHYLVNRAGRFRIGESASLFGYHDSWQNEWQEKYSDNKGLNIILQPGETIKWNTHPSFAQKDNPLRQTGLFQLSNKLNNGRFESKNLIFRENTSETNESGWLKCKTSLPYPIYGITINLMLMRGNIDICIKTDSGNVNKKFIYDSSGKTEQINWVLKENEYPGIFNDLTRSIEVSINSGKKTIYGIEKLEFMFYAYGKSLATLKNGINSCLLRFANKYSPKNLLISHGFIEFPGDSLKMPLAPAISADNLKLNIIYPGTSEKGNTYEYIISENSDCNIPISPKHQEFTSGKEIILENDSILMPDSKYYIKTRTINAAGVTGPWSKTISFRFSSVSAPDWKTPEYLPDGIKLKWFPVISNGQTVNYDIYGSSEKGFKPSKTPYEVWIKRIDDPAISDCYPANYIGTTTKDSFKITLETFPDDKSIPAHFRIIAYTDDNSGAPGEMLSISTPYIIKSSLPPVISAGHQYNCFVKTILSKGSLHFNRLPDKPINTSFLDREIPVYELVENPSWLQIRPNDGFLYGTPGESDRGQHKLIIKCSTHLGVSYAETSIKVI